MLAVFETHPVQYHAPVYRALQTRFGIPVTVIYGSDFSIAGYKDGEFGTTFAWDTDLLSGYTSIFLSRVSQGGARNFEEVRARGLGETLRELAPEAALILGYRASFNQVAFYDAWRQGYPILFRGETTDHAQQRSSMKTLLRDGALRWSYKRAAKLLYIGRRSYQHYKRLGCPDEKLIFSPYCVDTSVFQCDEKTRISLRSAVRQELGIEESQIVLLFSGKLSRRKGPDLFLRAVKQLPSGTRKSAVVLFLGSGELEADLKNLSNAEPHTIVHFLGFQNQTMLSRYYHASDLLVLPSREGETWGLMVNEALHHGVPCVVSDAVGCGLDLIEPDATGEVSHTGSLESLTSAITRALPMVGRGDVREKCREKVSGYTVTKAAKGISRAYREIVSLSHSAPSYA